jgi:nitroreductase
VTNMETKGDLYQAILTRRSVRRYEARRLDAETLAQAQEIASGVKPLVPGNRFEVLMRDVAPGEDLVQTMGGYGRLVSPPHYFVPYAVGERHVLTDLGYRVEQIVVRLTALGIGTCYVGSVGREEAVRALFELPDAARIGAFLSFGYPATGLGGRAVNAMARRAAGATNKLPVERIFFHEAFDQPATPPKELAPLVEAARLAPSAGNAQPWRLLWRDGTLPPRGTLYLFVQRKGRYSTGELGAYRFYDGGICMGNMALALEALGMAGHWELPAGAEPGWPHHPADLEPLAKLVLA